ncbi:MAG: ArsI/CadI family heavy metal resistance metalloenzyme [Alphaproteobacteria bacterium]|nr:ArsI/CadI family heavy metal resistance metalloenzyme [Alphaproteobacteria bacterium]
MRLQLALNVRDLDEAVTYYAKLFGTEPHKRRPGYANFAIAEPPLKLVLFENPEAEGRLNHLGIETLSADALGQAAKRLETSGIVERVEREVTCCHATQDKVWTRDPDGMAWEWYRITDDEPTPASERPSEACCPSEQDVDQAVC